MQSVFNFKKSLVNYNLPIIIYAVSDIQEVIFKRFGYTYGDYKPFASTLENFYYPAAVNSLEEFGVPNQIAKKIINNSHFDNADDIDSVINALILKDKDSYTYLTDFEIGFIRKALSYM